MTKNAAEIAQLITLAMKDIVRDVDGCYYYWPSAGVGAFSGWMLRAIADELDRLNRPYEEQIAKFFDEELKRNDPADR